MCADEPDKNSLYSELYYNYESVTIAFDVEHIPLIADAVGIKPASRKAGL